MDAIYTATLRLTRTSPVPSKSEPWAKRGESPREPKREDKIIKQELTPRHVVRTLVAFLIFGIAWVFLHQIQGTHQGVPIERTQVGETAAPTLRCEPVDFTLAKLRGRQEYDYARVTGIVTNHCGLPAGPQLKWTVYNRAGEVLTSEEFWPAGIRNLAEHQEYPFDFVTSLPPGTGKWRFTVQVIDARQW